MKIFVISNNSPYFNLASEYFFLIASEYANEDVLLFWKNANTIVIGRNQSLAAEINQVLAQKDQVKIVRRVSGGGAVFHDLGNICYSFIIRNQRKNFNFAFCLKQIIACLQYLGINAEFVGRNDLVVEQRKISGNAVYFYKNDYLLHGTLLFDVDIAKMLMYLTVDPSKLTSKGIASVKARVLNLKTLVPYDQSVFETKLHNYFQTYYQTPLITWNDTNHIVIQELMQKQFNNKAWIYNRDFAFNFVNQFKNDYGTLRVRLQTDQNIIKELSFESDGLFNLELNNYIRYFINQEYSIANIQKIAANLNLNQLLEGLKLDDLITLFFPQ